MKTRIIAACVLLPLFLLVVFVAPGICTAIMFGLMASIGAYELLHNTGIVKHIRLIVYGMIAAFLVALWSYFGSDSVAAQAGVLVFAAIMMAEVMCSHMKLPVGVVAACLIAGLLIPYLFTSLVRIHRMDSGRFYIVTPFVLAFLSDTGAYFAGVFFGKHKLAPVISPKKTVEGLAGGVLGAVLGMILYCVVLQFAFNFVVNYFYAIIYGILGSLTAVFGDLCFSVIKRQTGIKDYGNLIPGHGGILDRFDSMIFVGPLAEILLILLPLAV